MVFNFIKLSERKKKKRKSGYSILMTADEYEFLRYRNINKDKDDDNIWGIL